MKKRKTNTQNNEIPIIKLQQVPIVDVKRDCPYADMAILMMRLEVLKAKNHLQDVFVTRENIVQCRFDKETNQIDALLSFNEEKCYISVYSNKEESMDLRGRFERESLKMEVPADTINCTLRFGTQGTSSQN